MNSLDEQYIDLLEYILGNGTEKKDRTGTGTLSVFGLQFRHDMSEGFPLLTTKKMYWKGIVTELLWFLRGDTNIKYLVDNNCHIWDGDAYKAYLKKYEKDKLHGVIYENNETQNRPFSKEEFINWVKNNDKFSELYGELGPVYGKQWRSWAINLIDPNTMELVPPIDQIQNLINDLKTNPDSRRLMVSAWNVGELDSMTLPPCHYGFQVYTRELSLEERCKLLNPKPQSYDLVGSTHEALKNQNIPTRAISLMWNQRSVDTFLGLPFNIASYGLLLEIIAKEVNMVPDQLIGNLGDVHLYNNHIEQAKEQISRTPYKLPKLNINTEFWPYEGGECGEGPLDATAVFNSFKDDNFCKCLLEEDIQLGNYQSHPTIKAPLSN
jgi:thymidylate synthase